MVVKFRSRRRGVSADSHELDCWVGPLPAMLGTVLEAPPAPRNGYVNRSACLALYLDEESS